MINESKKREDGKIITKENNLAKKKHCKSLRALLRIFSCSNDFSLKFNILKDKVMIEKVTKEQLREWNFEMNIIIHSIPDKNMKEKAMKLVYEFCGISIEKQVSNFEETYNSGDFDYMNLPSLRKIYGFDTKIYDNFLNRILELRNKGLKWDNDDLFLNILNITRYYNEILLNKKNGLEEVLIKNINENIKITELQLFELEWIKKYDYDFDMNNNSFKIFMKNFIIRIIEWDDDMIVNINLNINENILKKIKWLVKNGCKINYYNIDKFIINVIEINDYNSKNWEFIKILKEFGYEMKLLINNKNLTLENIKFIFQNVNIEKYKKSQIIQSNLKININDFIKMNDINNVIWCSENGVNYDYTAFHTAIEVNNLEIMKILKKNECQIGIYCIIKAMEYKNIDIIKWVILNAPFDYEVFINCFDNEKSKFKENPEIINILNQIYDLDVDILKYERNKYFIKNKGNFFSKIYYIIKNEKKLYEEEDIQKLYSISTNIDYFTENQINRLNITFENLKIKKHDLNIKNSNVNDLIDFLLKISN